MPVLDKIRYLFASKRKDPPPYPTVTARVSKDEERPFGGMPRGFLSDLSMIMAKFPFEVYNVIDQLTLIDPYVSKFHATTVALGNLGHRLEFDTQSAAKAEAAIVAANDMAARCFPLAGGMDGLVNSLLSQVARTGGMCVEWVPDRELTKVERAFVVPIKTLRWRYKNDNELELVQVQGDKIQPLNMVQTAFNISTKRDTSPYPIPPSIAALESCASHRTIIKKIDDWMEKVSALGVLLASVTPPPREVGESQAQYDIKAQAYLEKIAKSIQENMSSGIGVGYNNIEFQFQNTQSSANGAQDILQIVLQGVFAALNRDPMFFGWHFNSTESYSRVVYEEMQQSIKAYQLGLKRVLEHGHRLNLVLQGMGDVGVSVTFNTMGSIDAFRDAEADFMKVQSILAQIEPGVISVEEARSLLGHDEIAAGSGEFVASFNKSDRRYQLINRESLWTGFTSDEDNEYERWLKGQIDIANREGSKALLLWLLLMVDVKTLPPPELFISEGSQRFIERSEKALPAGKLIGQTKEFLARLWKKQRGKGTLNGRETAAIDYLARVIDSSVVSEYLTRSQQRQERIRTFLEKIYKDIEDGKGREGISLEVSRFSENLADDSAEIIATTSMARAEVWASLYKLKASNVKQFKIDGPRDDRKCGFCWGMLDRVFSVDKALSRIDNIVSNAEKDFERDLPFLKDLLRGKDMSEVTNEELEAGVGVLPPYHPRCRDYVVPVR